MNTHRNAIAALIATATLAFAGMAHAGTAPKPVDTAKLNYERERADCMMGRTSQPKATCLKEAGAAYAQARQGRLVSNAEDADQLKANALRRCEVQKGEDRELCQRRVRGEGQVEGSVGGGGELESLTVRTVDIPKTPG